MRRFAGGILGLALLAFLLYRLRRRILSRWLRLRPHEYGSVQRRQVPIPLRDGIVLWGSHYSPEGPGPFPTVLIRSLWSEPPAGLLDSFIAQRFAARGYHVLVQNVRSSREPEQLPHGQEEYDTLDTAAWIEQQAWFDGNLGMWGASYSGYVQWRAAADAPDSLKAVFIAASASRWSSVIHPDGALALDTTMRMRYAVRMQEQSSWRGRLRMVRQQAARISAAARRLPVKEADLELFDEPDLTYRRLVRESDPGSGFWREVDRDRVVPQVRPAVHLLTGWYDIFLREQLADYRALVEAGRSPFLTVGPWSHLDPALGQASLAEGLAWFDTHLKGRPGARRAAAVRILVMGAGEWREFESWPPETQEQVYFPHAGGRLQGETPPAVQPPDQYLYNPERPTPAVGGALLHEAGQRDNRLLEERDDVLVYTAEPVLRPLTITGTVRAVLYVKSSLAHTDFFVRLSGVDPSGRSLNVTDGFVRIAPDEGSEDASGIRRLEVSLWPTAYTFLPGHAPRLLIAGGAHPRWNRNPGTAAPAINPGQVRVAAQSLYHDAVHASRLIMPVLPGVSSSSVR